MGWLDPDEMMAAIPAGLWAEWAAFFSAEPFGGVADDLRFGLLLCVLLNAFGGSKGSRIQPADIFASLRDARAGDEQTAEAMIEIARAWGALGGNDR